MPLTAIDLFAGAGGLSTGLEMANFRVVFANEVNPVYSTTLRKNHQDTLISVDDVRNLEPTQHTKELGSRKRASLIFWRAGLRVREFSINAPKRCDVQILEIICSWNF